ncbi:aspartyl beta-hydroxylase [Pseudoalteromonas aliena]|jgi:hypothetical protein|uniref:Aspartyl beta-hydroxylase n=1 Tax=Pseudoalteromonas aliena TaxID=247523 RepID=A0A1Q2H370_9GAMM|nr:aspartyl/asparaginyl beta-hydroxylase domain-containing protein [Pseudoalteromonas aliena]AQQ01808.1 aspartyl beta-hydroxylase [Pseudoalteromonas aliena]
MNDGIVISEVVNVDENIVSPVISFAQLDIFYDIKKVAVDLVVAKKLEWVEHVNTQCYQGGWDVLPLRVPVEHADRHVILQSFAIESSSDFIDGDHLKYLPSISELLSQFKCDILSARLMRLSPNSLIKPHRDLGLSIELSAQARIHISLEACEQVEFLVDCLEVPMSPNSCWYINADAEHSVINNGDTPRINLVIDCNVNEWLLSLIMESKDKAYCCKKVS